LQIYYNITGTGTFQFSREIGKDFCSVGSRWGGGGGGGGVEILFTRPKPFFCISCHQTSSLLCPSCSLYGLASNTKTFVKPSFCCSCLWTYLPASSFRLLLYLSFCLFFATYIRQLLPSVPDPLHFDTDPWIRTLDSRSGS
jgi:hypothetical protein